MSAVTRKRREECLTLRTKLEPYAALIDRSQTVLLWMDTPGKAAFIALCIFVHIALGWANYMVQHVGVLTTVSLLAALYVLGQFLFSVVELPFSNILDSASSREELQSGDVRPYTLDEIARFLVTLKFAFKTILIEMERLKAINLTKYTVQAALLWLIIAYIGTMLSGYSLVYLLSYTILLLPGVYSHGLIGKAIQVLEPYCGQVFTTIRQQVHQLMQSNNIGAVRPPHPLQHPAHKLRTGRPGDDFHEEDEVVVGEEEEYYSSDEDSRSDLETFSDEASSDE
ncbi:hypothetical protein QOT17_024268 [Balamuthia mandrillaris]